MSSTAVCWVQYSCASPFDVRPCALVVEITEFSMNTQFRACTYEAAAVQIHGVPSLTQERADSFRKDSLEHLLKPGPTQLLILLGWEGQAVGVSGINLLV